MPLEQFWALVAEVDWATRLARPIDEGKSILRERLSRVDAAAFHARLQELRFSLHKVLTDWQEETGKEFEIGDDSFDDLICHIIGLGQREYEAVLADPAVALERAETGDFLESFLYLAPQPDDYRDV
jgi:hypothetical protein